MLHGELSQFSLILWGSNPKPESLGPKGSGLLVILITPKPRNS